MIIMICMFEVIHYYLHMYLKMLEIKALKYIELDPANFLSAPGLAWQPCLKNKNIKL